MSKNQAESLPSAESAPSFEAALDQLEAIVVTMEQGDLPLEEALKSFETGVNLVRTCEDKLKTAEQKVQILMQSGNKSELRDFDVDTESTQDFSE